MTRINSAIPVKNLTDEYLLAEHREIKRLPWFLIHSSRTIEIPQEFCLGKGHVKFFMNKFLFTYHRYQLIYKECCNRGFNVENYSNNWQIISMEYCLTYIPTKEEKELLINRISERINSSSKEYFHYYKKKISKQEAIELLNT